MKILSKIISPVIKGFLGLICKVDSSEMKKVPRKGPLIVVLNHINFLEVPLIYTHLLPRDLASIVKRETWKNPLLGCLGNIWEAIPLDRRASDISAMRKSLKALKDGRVLIIAPEGTRSGTGCLQSGHAGVVQIALHSGAPIIPIAHFGGEAVWKNIKKFRRTPFTFRVGKPFYINKGVYSKNDRKLIIDDIMKQLSLLLPVQYRGIYQEPEKSISGFLDFIEVNI